MNHMIQATITIFVAKILSDQQAEQTPECLAARIPTLSIQVRQARMLR
jgi:hypothetical protein